MTEPDRIYLDYRGPIVSTNAAYRRGKGFGLFMTSEGKAFKAGLAAEAKRAMSGRFPISGPVSVMVDFWFRTRANDVDGPLKLVLDSLQGHVFVNDRQVVFVSAAKHKADDQRQVGLALTVTAVPDAG